MSPSLASSDARSASSKIHLTYIDGIRALAALFVAFGHCYVNVNFRIHNDTLQLTGVLSKIQLALFFLIFRFGHYAVDIFIVLSGFCLMLPIARTGTDSLRGSYIDYIKRRARRILPPYYAALFLSLLVAVLVPALQQSTGYWQNTLPSLTTGSILTHLFLVHNLTPFIWTINTPLWSIATEWQIYFLFPLMLWLKRKYGMRVTLIAAFIVGLVPHFVIGSKTDQAYPWYIGLFALGMAAADLCFNQTRSDLMDLRRRVPWLPLSCLLFFVVAVLSQADHVHLESRPFLGTLVKSLTAEWELDILVALLGVCIFAYCVEQTGRANSRSGLLRLFNFPPLVNIGIYSYSLYLTHTIVLALVDIGCQIIHLPASLFLVVMYFLTIPLALPVAYAFHCVCERPFLSSNQKKHVSVVNRVSETSEAA